VNTFTHSLGRVIARPHGAPEGVRIREVRVTNLAVDGKMSDQLLAELRSDPTTRRDVAHAEIVLIGIGGARAPSAWPGAGRPKVRTRGTPCGIRVRAPRGRPSWSGVSVRRRRDWVYDGG
jgi:hypothetical protein